MRRLSACLAALFLSTSVSAQDSQPIATTGRCGKKGTSLDAPRPTGASETPIDPRLIDVYEARKRFEEEAAEYRADIHELITGEYLLRKNSLETGYDKELAQKERDERAMRDSAIRYFEAFLQQYKNDERYAPDAMYRLAELYFERDNLAYLDADTQYQKDIELFDKNLLSVEPVQPVQNYDASIRVFTELITLYPSYQYIDGAYYLLGYCLSSTNENNQAMVWFGTLVERFPESRVAPEAHLRIGEILFSRNDYLGALASYGSVITSGGKNYLDKALYKLGWTNYRLGIRIVDDVPKAYKHFEDSIARFRELLDMEEASGVSSALSAESQQYLQIDLTEDWSGDGVADWTDDPTQQPVERAKRYLDTKKQYTQKILVGTAEILFSQRYNDQAILLYEYAVEQYPFHPDNPKLLTKAVDALERDGKLDEALRLREVIVKNFGKDSAWAAKQDIATRESALSLAEEALIKSALKHHAQGQELRDEWKQTPTPALFDAWQAEYKVAAELYKRYLLEYTSSPNSYELGFYYAECLFYSSRFLEAAEQYTRVRELSPTGEYFENAANSLIASLENEIKVQVANKTLEIRTSPPEANAEAGAIEGGLEEPIPPLVERLIQSQDYVIQNIPEPCSKDIDIGKSEYAVAIEYYNYGHFREARERFERIIARYPKAEIASDSAKLYVDSFRLEGNIIAQKAAADKYLTMELGPQGKGTTELDEQRFKVDYQYALKLFEQKKFDEAANLLVSLVDKRPNWEFAAKAINDAAVSFENAKRYDSATKNYERLARDFPKSEFAANAVYRVGINAERFFEFDKAVSSYLKLLGTYKDFEEKKRLDALLAIAKIKENNRDYADAAKYYEQAHDDFLKTTADKWDPSRALFFAAEIRKKGNLFDPAIKTYNRYVSLYRDKEHAEKVLQALTAIAEIAELRKKPDDARKQYEAVVRAFDDLGVAPGSPASEYAAKAKFVLIEPRLDEYEAIGFKFKDPSKAEKFIKEKFRLLADVQKLYAEIIKKYQSPTWSLAATYQQGYLFKNLADTWYSSNPFKEGSIEYDDYQAAVEEQAVKGEDSAVSFFKACYNKGKELKIENEWTQRALEQLNKFLGSQEYPLPKPPKTEVLEDAGLRQGAELP